LLYDDYPGKGKFPDSDKTRTWLRQCLDRWCRSKKAIRRCEWVQARSGCWGDVEFAWQS